MFWLSDLILFSNKGNVYKVKGFLLTKINEKEIPLTVHHYIEGTTTQVPLKTGGTAGDQINKGKEGKVLKIFRSENRILVDGVNVVKKHVKPNGQNAGSIVEMEAPIHASNVMILDPKSNKGTRIGHTTDKKGKKIRISRSSNENLD